MNDQHPPLRAGDRVTYVHQGNPLPLIVNAVRWDPDGGEWYVTASDPAITVTFFRRAAWFARGWP